MIGRLRGQIVSKTLHQLVVEVGGLGFAVLVPDRLATETLLETEVVLYTYLQVREDALTLYGFSSSEEKELFEHLVGVSGIGPKLALAVLSAYRPTEIRQAIAGGQAQFFSAVSGIGKKNAERIILELKNKVGGPQIDGATASGSSDLTEALVALGYSTVEVAKASQGVSADLPLDQQIKQGLAKLAAQK